MEQLWAPWRLAYVAAKPPGPDEPCFMCRGLAEDDDRNNLIALRTPLCAVVLNKFPYNNGHLLIVPRAHKARLQDLSTAESAELHDTLTRMLDALDALMRPDGYNVGLNLGRAAGAGVPGHLHWHVVPRWHGDTNFMPALTDVRVIVQSLEAFYDLLTDKLRDA